ncbi:MAG: HIT domain-containing protein [Gemmatimonadetes bacterium]|nr:HIT domain-containing protein [Gemmatimonadota bacterium]NIO32663.1 HIT domain-containing protein [Gemmatimonadota bacterium]
MADCLFCKIAAGEIPAEKVKEADDWIAFRDISPQAPTHVLIIPREHIATLNDVDAGKEALLGKLFLAAKQIAAEEGIAESGYRAVVNCNADAGQAVFHIHMHLLGGREMGWPPG